MDVQQVPSERWVGFLRGFEAEHAGEHVCIELFDPEEPRDPRLGGDLPLVPADSDHRVGGHELTLRGMNLESAADGLAMVIAAETSDGKPALYIVPRIAGIWSEEAPERAGASLRIDGANGQSLFLRLGGRVGSSRSAGALAARSSL